MDDEKLIDLVRGEEILYNKFCVGYRFPDKKLRAWTNIAQQLGATEEECKKRWTSLRERFSRECKRMDAPSGSGASYSENWPLFGALRFLKEHVKPRPFRFTVNICDNSASSSSLQSPLLSPPPPPDAMFTEEAAATPSLSRSRKRRRAVETDVDEEFREACKSFRTQCSNQETKENAAVKAFGQMIVATVTGMSVRGQTNAIRKLTDLAMTLKLEDEEVYNAFQLID